MRTRIILLALVFLLLATTPVFAQTTAGGTDQGLKTIGLVIGMGIGAGLCGIGQGHAAAGAAEAIARNPGAAAGVRFALILGLAFIESLALYVFVAYFLSR
ncbi:MAG TPA: ATP synthase F0 subunit C [Bryobacteraceae bacterium]|nr:ATP synthase F0 subunit C [Bryobacteraceae bacterium]